MCTWCGGISRYTVLCVMWPRKLREYISWKKDNSIFRHAQLNGIFSKTHQFFHYSCPPGTCRVGHTENLIKFSPAICEIWVLNFIVVFFLAVVGYGGFEFFFLQLIYKIKNV